MNELMELAVPPYDGAPDWPRVLRDARAGRRRRIAFRLTLGLTVAAAAVAIALAGSPPSTLDRALAAAGSGRVLHLVFEGELPKTIVDLRTGERRPGDERHEVWFDPNGVTLERETFEGALQWEALNPSEHGRQIYSSLGAGYRDALRTGRAKVVGEDDSDYWIEIAPEHIVAVSRKTYVPVAMRVAGMEARILTYETIDKAPEPQTSGHIPGPLGQPGPSAKLRSGDVWAGRRGLTAVREIDGGLQLEYADALILQSARVSEAVTMLVGLSGYAPPPGQLVLAGNNALLRVHGRIVALHTPTEESTLALARALRVR